ncbi:MAG: alpha/beta fold hydrolase [Holophagales bacterium]|nr:alpha/beta fold hydrolase [Holophagales bacterium]MBK9968444.1 alpha/beta fold hydrolase [Holophagales bacterium]
MTLRRGTAFRRPAARRVPAAHLVVLTVLTVLIASVTLPVEAATRKRKSTKKAAPIPEVPRPHDPFAVSFPSSDGVRLVATWKPSPAGPSAPAVLLLHAFSRERREVAFLADELAARGFSTLALDLRGHGESVWKGGVRLGTSPSLQTSPNGFPRDVEAACAWLGPRATRVGVFGLSLSGNLAALATAAGWAEAAVAVSANADRFEKLAGTRPKSPTGLLVLASEKDPGRAGSARLLENLGRAPKSVVLYPGTAHALELLKGEPAAKDAAFAWLEARLGPVTPPPAPVATIPVPAPEPAPAAAPAPGGESR